MRMDWLKKEARESYPFKTGMKVFFIEDKSPEVGNIIKVNKRTMEVIDAKPQLTNGTKKNKFMISREQVFLVTD